MRRLITLLLGQRQGGHGERSIANATATSNSSVRSPEVWVGLILGAIAEFERARIAERVKAGVERARRQGRRRRGRHAAAATPRTHQKFLSAETVGFKEGRFRGNLPPFYKVTLRLRVGGRQLVEPIEDNVDRWRCLWFA